MHRVVFGRWSREGRHLGLRDTVNEATGRLRADWNRLTGYFSGEPVDFQDARLPRQALFNADQMEEHGRLLAGTHAVGPGLGNDRLLAALAGNEVTLLRACATLTGALRDNPGRIAASEGGTLFLDEIGDLPHPLQVKLLRFLQDQIVERIGGRQKIQVDTRIVSATNAIDEQRWFHGADEVQTHVSHRLRHSRALLRAGLSRTSAAAGHAIDQSIDRWA